jgi:tetratricopeptide (TPR) repeat protein
MEVLKSLIKYNLLILLLVNFTATAQYDKLIDAFKKSYELEKKGEYKKAANVLKEVYDPKSYEINLRLGWLNYQAVLFTESSTHYKRAVDLMPYAIEAKFGLIYPKAAIGKWDEVIAIYNEILKIDPQNTIANYRLGLIYYGRKEYENAEKYFKKVVNLYPFGYDSLIMLAWTEFQLGKYREAKVLFYKVLLYNPDDASAKDGLKRIK